MIKDNILKIRARISSACSRINRNPAEVDIIAVCKARSIEQIEEVLDSGVTDIGENRVQEALLKYNQLPVLNQRTIELKNQRTIKWHMVGHLQANKAKDAVKIFDLIHSVDSLRLAIEINKQAVRINKVQDILLEVKVSSEAAKTGFKPEETVGAVKQIVDLPNINIRGLMTIAPLVGDPEKARPYFKLLRQLRDKINELQVMSYELRVLSMGMTDDFEAAIEEGANMVRLGRAIFEG